jgi:hypothetical protein
MNDFVQLIERIPIVNDGFLRMFYAAKPGEEVQAECRAWGNRPSLADRR